MTTAKPIFCEFTNANPRNGYASYTISRGGATIYNGKSWVDANGKSVVRVDKILRDFVYRWDIVTDYSTQRQQPAALIPTIGTAVPTIESGSSFWLDDIAVQMGSTTKHLSVSGAWTPPWMSAKAVSGFTNYAQILTAYGKALMPRIPLVDTDKFWLGVVLNLHTSAGTFGIYSGMNSAQLALTAGGTNAFAISLHTLYNGCALNTAAGGYQIGSSSKKYNLCAVDICPAAYYVAWITPAGGWQSYGFNGNVSVKATTTQKSIINTADEGRVYRNENSHTYQLYTEYVTAAEYAHLMTIEQSRLAYVYDVELDEGYYCTPVPAGLATLPSHSTAPQCYYVELKRITAETN